MGRNRPDFFKINGIKKQDDILTIPPGGGRNKTVEAKEGGCGRDLLRTCVEQFTVASILNP